ncbi:Spy/CpxP family protein refolding chaperone [Pseudoduganella sp. UC29_106]|uniref:Spy/CpxP family protein refolding chaperone n=1 Tax=Pseudoduganella sp. UC29_106 TaxID=3374553 RepID=UPI00375830F0
MKTLQKVFIIGAAVIGMSSAAFSAQAQDATPHRQYAATKFDPAKMAERMDKRMQKLHDALKLTSNQEGAWQTYASAIKADMPTTRPDFASFKNLSAPEKMEKRIEFAKTHITHMENHLAALKTFYAVLTPEQQKTFDQAMSHGRHGRGGHHGDPAARKQG